MSAKLPNGNLTAQEILLALAEPLADKDGFVDLHQLLDKMKSEAKKGFPINLRREEVNLWARLVDEYTKHAPANGPAIARISGQQIAVLTWLDENIMTVLKRYLGRAERERVDSLSNYDRARLYWIAKEMYQGDEFSHQDIERLRQWARSRFQGWPRKLRFVGPT